MTVKTTLVKDVVCDHCGESVRTTESTITAARGQMATIGWATKKPPLNDSRRIRDLCSVCKLIEVAA